MRQNLFRRLWNVLTGKAMPSALAGSQWSGTSYTDSYKRYRNPTPNEIMAELKGTAWTCASLNASICASNPPRLYATTQPGQREPKCPTRPVKGKHALWVMKQLGPHIKGPVQITEVIHHPMLDLLAKVNPLMNGFDLWELTTLYQEVHGIAYWHVAKGPLGQPSEIWPLPSQNMTPRRRQGSSSIVDYFEYRSGYKTDTFTPDEIICFRYPDPKDPYLGGLAPLRACWEQAATLSDYTAFKRSRLENDAIPAAIVTPDEVVGEEERARFETEWNQKFRRGGAGRVVVGESPMKVNLLQHTMGDIAQLAEMGATKEDIANAFHTPLSFLTKETNLANLQAAQGQHMSQAIAPRLQRRDQKLNEQFVPMFDDSGRLFLASDDPVPLNWDADWRTKDLYLKYGIYTINDIRNEEGLDPVPWGNVPWLPLQWAPTDDHVARQAITSGTVMNGNANNDGHPATESTPQRNATTNR